MRPRLLAALVALSLSQAAPAAQAAPTFSVSSIDPLAFALSPGASCSAQPPNNIQLPEATSTGTGDISYTITPTLPTGITFDTIAVELISDPATIAVRSPRTYTYTARDADDGQTASLTFTLAVVDERAVLEALYTATGGDTWTNQTDADTTNDWPNKGADPYTIPDTTCLDELHGVSLVVGQVSRIQLSDNQLTGRIPDLSGLPYLDSLWLNENQLTGPIPPSLPPTMRQLNLHSNQLTGSIPSLPASLTLLYLYDNQLTGRIPTLSGLTDLTELNLHTNQLTGSIPSLPTSLTYLDLGGNRLTGRIPTLSGLTNLTNLYLNHNRLSGTVPDLSALSNLVHLYLNGNRLSGLIPDLDDVMPASLTDLYLHNNQLSGSLPDVTSLTNLNSLHLHTNRLSGPLPDVSALTRLREFGIGNKLGAHTDGTVTIISELASKLPAGLQRLWLSKNGLSGEIPDLSSLGDLTWLELQDNALTGGVPDLSLTGNTALYLHNNRLSGAVPAFSNVTGTIFRLSLYGNPGLYDYPAALNTKTSLRLLAPGTGAAVCLYREANGAADTTDCTVPTLVDNLRVQASPTQLVLSWKPKPTDPAPAGYAAQYYDPTVPTWIDATVTGTIAAPTATITGLTPGTTYSFLVRTTDASTSPQLYYVVTLPERRPPPPPPSGGGGGGGGGGTRTPDDRHGDTPEEATSLLPRRYTTGVISRRIDAHLQSRRDVDYFTLTLPSTGVLTAATTGADTTGRLYQAQPEGPPLLIAEDTDSGSGANFRLGEAVEPGTYYLAVSAGRGSGEYRLTVHYTPAAVGNPAPDSFQSGVSVLSGWVCAADTVEIELVPASGDPQTWVPATGTSRPDTAVACGPRTTDTGYGLLFNWNRLGDGEHTVRVWMDDVLVDERQITVTTLGAHPAQEFRTDLSATTEVADFPAVGETTTLRWEQARQNFMIAGGAGGGTGQQRTPTHAQLGNPAPGSFQSGVGVVSGWACDAETVEIAFETAAGTTFTEEAGYGTARPDTADVCGDTDNGFGLLVNWNRLGTGQHTVRASADGEEFAHSTFNVTTLGAHADEEFRRGLRKTHAIADFPAAGQTTTVEWQTGQQNFVIVGVTDGTDEE